MMTQSEIVNRGYQALVEALGVVGAIRFVQHFSQGSGDYTEERHQWLEQDTVEVVLKRMEGLSEDG